MATGLGGDPLAIPARFAGGRSVPPHPRAAGGDATDLAALR